MSRDMSEYIDDYCRDMYQHTNWAYMSTFSKEEIAQLPKGHEEGGVYFFEEEDNHESQYSDEASKVFYRMVGNLRL